VPGRALGHVEEIALKKETEDRLLDLAGILIASVILFVIGFGAGLWIGLDILPFEMLWESPVPLLIIGLIVGAFAACLPFTINYIRHWDYIQQRNIPRDPESQPETKIDP